MTAHYTNTQWRDTLYNTVRKADGGVSAAATFLTERRDTSIHPESLRRKLKGDEQLDVDVAVLLTEWLERDVTTSDKSRDWLLSLCAQEGLFVDFVPPPPVSGHPDELAALQEKLMEVMAKVGKIAAELRDAIADGVLCQNDADMLVPLFRAGRVILHRMERNVLRAVSKGRAQ
jgi:hypothetical protein